MRLGDVDPDRYAREVLPQTAALWAGRRDFATYVAQTLEIAHGAYGRRSYRTAALYAGDAIVASFKRYARTMQAGGERVRATGIGAVFTPPEYRGRGYASAMLAMELDRARRDGGDVVYLFSDIRPQFYAELGFRELPSREISLRSDRLPARRLVPARLQERDWSGIRRCFEYVQRRSTAGFTRTPLVWGWMRMRMRHGSERAGGQETDLVVRRGGAVAAYVLGQRDAARDTYVLDEIGFAGEAGAAVMPALLRAAAGDLRKISGWLPPEIVRELLPKGSVRNRRLAIFMAAPLSARGSRLVNALAGCGDADPCWHADHI
jgi:predicted N-acetyltransferase YhbS